MAEVNIPVSDEFTGDANTIRDAIASYLSNNLNTIGDGTNQLEIQPQIQAEGKQDFFSPLTISFVPWRGSSFQRELATVG